MDELSKKNATSRNGEGVTELLKSVLETSATMHPVFRFATVFLVPIVLIIVVGQAYPAR
jgi:hypothetical protein